MSTVKVTTLGNGLRVAVDEMPEVESASLGIWVACGTRHEAAELNGMGQGVPVERIARKLVADGQLTAWRYAVGRAPDGSTRFAANGKVAILRNDTLRIEPYTAPLPIAPPPSE